MADDTKVDFYFYYHSNHLGSTNFVTRVAKSEDEDKPRHEMYEHVEYIPFGETWIEEREVLPFGGSKSNRYLFTSKEFDQETRLYYYGARYYDPKTSVWLSADPALGKYLPTFPTNEREQEKLSINPIHYWANKLPGRGGVFNSPNLNLYVYTHQNPVKLVDPDGAAVFTGAAVAGWVGKSALEGASDVALDKTIAHLSGEEYGTWDAVKSFGSGFGLGLLGLGAANKLKKLNRLNKLRKAAEAAKKAKGILSRLVRDSTGKIHGDLPKFVPKSWKKDQIKDVIKEVKGSITRRQEMNKLKGVDKGHSRRIGEEEHFLKQLEKRLKNFKDRKTK